MIKYILCSIVLVLAILTSTMPAWAACTTTTYIINGKVMTCTTCCFNGNCTVNCF